MGQVSLYTDTQASYYFFSDIIRDKTDQSYLYFLPVNRAVRHLKRKIISQHKNSALIDPLVFTFNSFVKYLNHHLVYRKKIITPSMQLVLIENLWRKNQLQLKGSQLSDVLTAGSSLTIRLAQLVSELVSFGLSDASFDDPPPGAEQKYADFSRLIRNLSASYADDLSDETSIMAEVLAIVQGQELTNIFPQLQDIYISGYGIYTPLMLQYIRQLKHHFNIHICLNYSEQNQQLFRHTQRAYDALLPMADSIKKSDWRANQLESVIFLEKGYQTLSKKIPCRFRIQSTQNPQEEIAFIAARIKMVHEQEQVPLHRMGITFPHLESYAPLIRNVFKKYQLPYNLSTGFALSQSPLIQTYIKMLELIVRHFPCDEVFDLLRTPFIDIQAEHEFSILERLIKKSRMRRFSEHWHDKLKTHTGSRSVLMEQTDKHEIQDLIRSVEDILNVLRSLDNSWTPAEFQHNYINCMQSLGMLNWYNRDTTDLTRGEQELEFRALNKFIKLLNEMIWILQNKSESARYSITEYLRFLKLIIQDATYNLREWSDYGVQIMPRLEIQSVPLDILFIGGCIEGDFPRKVTRDIFFNDEERQQMGLYTSEEFQYQDRFIFYQLLIHPDDCVYLTYPRTVQNTKQVRSTFLDHLTSLTRVTESDEFPADYRINHEDILIYAGRSLRTDESEPPTNLLQMIPESEFSFWRHSLQILYHSMERTSQTKFEGALTMCRSVTDHLKNNNHGSFSVTALESYRFCPMQYFIQRILGVEADEELDHIISAIEKGLLIHEILYCFYSELKTRNEHATPWMFLNRLTEIAREQFDELPFQGFLWQLILEDFFGSETSESLWQAFLRMEEYDQTVTGYRPEFFELAFGLRSDKNKIDPFSSSRPYTLKFGDREIHIRGKIDRVDINPDGYFRVVDYKTGRAAKKIRTKDMLEGFSLQLPVYLVSAKEILKKNGYDLKPGAGMYIILAASDSCENYIAVKIKDIDPILANLNQNIIDIVGGIQSGNFTHTLDPENVRCSRYCAYNKICRKDVAKLISLAATKNK